MCSRSKGVFYHAVCFSWRKTQKSWSRRVKWEFGLKQNPLFIRINQGQRCWEYEKARMSYWVSLCVCFGCLYGYKCVCVFGWIHTTICSSRVITGIICWGATAFIWSQHIRRLCLSDATPQKCSMISEVPARSRALPMLTSSIGHKLSAPYSTTRRGSWAGWQRCYFFTS